MRRLDRQITAELRREVQRQVDSYVLFGDDR